MLAQALVEYGTLSALVATIERAAATVEDVIRRVDGRVAGVLGLVIIVLLLKRR